MIRSCGLTDEPAILHIVNAAAVAYRGVIPADRLHDPYMPAHDLRAEIAAGVAFSGYDAAGLVGVMGVQRKANVDLIRHAYTLPAHQGRGVGTALLTHLTAAPPRPILIGTWGAADWAVRFYQRHGFTLVADAAIAPLLRTYWTIPERQIETSVVLATPALNAADAARLIAEAQAGRIVYR